MTKVRLLALMAVAALLLIFPAVAFGQQIPPHLSAITANVDGAPASNGTVVTAWIDGNEVGSGEVTDGVAILIISGDASFTGKTISFKIGDFDAAETDTWEQGGHVNPELTISATSAMEATAVPPTAMMVATAAPVKGDKGDKGDTGAAGATGPAGAAGAAGATGNAGPAGSAGADGATGATGPAGPAGAAGAAGEGGGGGAIGLIALILAIVAIVVAGGAFAVGRRAA
ncbi:MAG: hypothetical protein BZY80_07240 [SAR202 cluster bacterium Io17-Chloro-G2]|nr:MAG: hypothetical protein BZY80_07240 [SAR202 cluster bacterium Io17-Chloro-G2]